MTARGKRQPPKLLEPPESFSRRHRQAKGYASRTGFSSQKAEPIADCGFAIVDSLAPCLFDNRQSHLTMIRHESRAPHWAKGDRALNQSITRGQVSVEVDEGCGESDWLFDGRSTLRQ